MIKKILIIGGVGFILSLSLFTGLFDMLLGGMTDIKSTVMTIPLVLRPIFFAGILGICWAFYEAVLT